MHRLITGFAGVALAVAFTCGSANAQYPAGYGSYAVPNFAPAPVQQMAPLGSSYNYFESSGSYRSGFQSPTSSFVQGQTFRVGGYYGNGGYGSYYDAGQYMRGSQLSPAGIHHYGSYQNHGQFQNTLFWPR